MSKILQAIVIIALPMTVFLVGGWLMEKVSGRTFPADEKPLGRRFGYTADDAKKQWEKLANSKSLETEKHFLELDLVYPFLYGGALAFSLFMAWAALGGTFNAARVLPPVLIMVLMDVTENIAQLHEMKRFMADHAVTLNANWIRIASFATTFKWLFVWGVSLYLLVLVGLMLYRAIIRS